MMENGGFFGGDGIWAVIIFALIFGFGNGFGGRGVQNQYTLASDFATIQRQISDSTNATERKLDGLANGLCDLGYTNQGLINGVNENVLRNGYDGRIELAQSTNALQNQMQKCCCDNEKLTMQSDYLTAKEACDTRKMISEAKQEIIGFMTNDKLATLQAENQALKSNAYLINTLRPCPVPSYNVPYYGGYGYGTTIA